MLSPFIYFSGRDSKKNIIFRERCAVLTFAVSGNESTIFHNIKRFSMLHELKSSKFVQFVACLKMRTARLISGASYTDFIRRVSHTTTCYGICYSIESCCCFVYSAEVIHCQSVVSLQSAALIKLYLKLTYAVILDS